MPWLIANPVTGDWKIIERFPFLVGGGNEESPYDFLVSKNPGPWFYLEKKGSGIWLCFSDHASTTDSELNGVPCQLQCNLKQGQAYALTGGLSMVFFLFHSNPQEWMSDNHPWRYFVSGNSGKPEGPYSATEALRNLTKSPSAEAVVWLGEGALVRAQYFLSLFESSQNFHESHYEPIRLLPLEGEFACPHCGEFFADHDVLAVAVHESLRGDNLLPDQMLRFKPEKTDGVRPLDAHGYPCPDLACPWCHQKLPPDFLKGEPFNLRSSDGKIRRGKSSAVISLVGGQRAGKSYFLAIQADRVPSVLTQETDLRWENHHPEGNMSLENYKDRILGARTPEEAAIEKTLIGGITYREVHKGGREIPMPVPFHYRISAEGGHYPLTCTFYDNAGEHFTPNEPVEKNPGSLHVARAEAIMFLFDPLQSPRFVQAMSKLGVSDPQLRQPMPDLQEVILSEMKTRIHRVKNLGPGDKLEIPLAFIVGKYDAWGEIITEDQRCVRTEILKSGRLCLESLEHNSHLARELMKKFAPATIRNVEALASNVLYFPVSTFGHHAVETSNGKGFAPDPRRIEPVLIEAPFLWILHRLRPDLLPSG